MTHRHLDGDATWPAEATGGRRGGDPRRARRRSPTAVGVARRVRLAARGFNGEGGPDPRVAGADGEPATLLVGLGAVRRRSGPTRLRRAGRRRGPGLPSRPASSPCACSTPSPTPAGRPAAAQALAEGLVLGSLPLPDLQVRSRPGHARRSTGSSWSGAVAASARRARARRPASPAAWPWPATWSTRPAATSRPTKLAEVAVEIAEREGLAIVGARPEGHRRGRPRRPAGREPGLDPAGPVHPGHLRRRPGARDALALVGKGITFDSGGLSLKTAAGHDHHEGRHGRRGRHPRRPVGDPGRRPKVEIRAYIPATDNMTGGDATRVGDVLRIRNGKTVEVLNTDAEGRLVLADGLSMASEAEPDAIVDLATLTGAVEVALGQGGGRPVRQPRRLGHARWPGGGEQVGRAGLDPAARRGLPVAHRLGRGRPARTSASRGQAGAIIAGLFLREFVGDGIPWAHLDIAGTAWSDADDLDITEGRHGLGRAPAGRAGPLVPPSGPPLSARGSSPAAVRSPRSRRGPRPPSARRHGPWPDGSASGAAGARWRPGPHPARAATGPAGGRCAAQLGGVLAGGRGATRSTAVLDLERSGAGARAGRG